MNHKPWSPVIWAFFLTTGWLLGRYMSTPRGAHTLDEALDIIADQYVDSVSEKEMTQIALNGLLHQLDPHSVFISKEEKEQINAPLQGNFQGIGVEFSLVRDTVFVMRVIPGGPAEKAGLWAADKLILANGKQLTGLNYHDIAGTIKGKAGTQCKLIISRKGRILEKTVIREKIEIPSITACFMRNKTTGYIKLDQFSARTTAEFAGCIDSLRKAGMKNLILDLRDNSGGYLQAATEMLDEFVDAETVLTYTQGRKGNKEEFKGKKGGKCADIGLVCLVNGQSASASELFCGAIQDLDRGKIIGTRTFGKGLVQEHFGLSDGSLIRLTIARYYTPKGRSIQKSYFGLGHEGDSLNPGGILPDIIMPEERNPEDYTLFEETVRYLYIEELQKRGRQKRSANTWANDQGLLRDLETQIIKENPGINEVLLKQMQREVLLRLIRSSAGESAYYSWKYQDDNWLKQADSSLLNTKGALH